MPAYFLSAVDTWTSYAVEVRSVYKREWEGWREKKRGRERWGEGGGGKGERERERERERGGGRGERESMASFKKSPRNHAMCIYCVWPALPTNPELVIPFLGLLASVLVLSEDPSCWSTLSITSLLPG